MTYANLGISSAKRENMGVWGRSPQRGAGAEPLLIGVGDGRVVCVVVVLLCCVVLCCVVLCALVRLWMKYIMPIVFVWIAGANLGGWVGLL